MRGDSSLSLTIDASVFVSAAMPSEAQFDDSNLFLDHIRLHPQVLQCPMLLLPEVAASLARRTDNAEVGQNSIYWVTQFPTMSLLMLDMVRTLQASQIAAMYRLRGADAIYVAIAQEFGTTLITWDREMLTRGLSAVSIMTPTDWLAANAIS